MKLIKPNPQPTTLAGFSRASTATYIDDAGVLQTAAANTARYQGGQLLVEGEGTNRLAYSNQFDNAVWIKSAGSVTVDSEAGPDGNTSADVFSITGQQLIQGLSTPAFTADGISAYTFSVYVSKKAASLPVRLYFRSGIGSGLTYAELRGDLLTGFSSFIASSATSASYQWESLPGHWRLSITAAGIPSGSMRAHVRQQNLPVGESIAFYGAQVEDGALSSYIPTTTAAATRAADVIAGAGLLSTTATDATPAYAAGTTYSAGAQVQYNRSRYESLQASNTGRTPDVSPTWWARLGPVNQWAMFDDQVSTQTEQAAGPLRVALQTGAMDSLAVLGLDADRVRLVVQDGAGGPVVYDREQGLAAEAVVSWFDYFFSDPTFRRTQALFSGIPPFGASVATLTFSSGSPVKVGYVSYGRVRSLGGLRYGARAGIKDFSRKDTDEFGVTTFVRRANSKYITGTLEVDKFAINQVHNLLTSLTATPVVWIGSDDVYYSDTLLVFGFFRDFYCSIDYPTLAIYSLEIEGLT